MLSKIYITCFIILVYRMCLALPIPFCNPILEYNIIYSFDYLNTFDFLNFFSGSTFRHYTICSVGLIPFICVSLIQNCLNLIIQRNIVIRLFRPPLFHLFIFLCASLFAYIISNNVSHFIEVSIYSGQVHLFLFFIFIAGSYLTYLFSFLINKYGFGNGFILIISLNILSELSFFSSSYISISNLNNIAISYFFIFLLTMLIVSIEYSYINISEGLNSAYIKHVKIPLNILGVFPLIFLNLLYNSMTYIIQQLNFFEIHFATLDSFFLVFIAKSLFFLSLCIGYIKLFHTPIHFMRYIKHYIEHTISYTTIDHVAYNKYLHNIYILLMFCNIIYMYLIHIIIDFVTINVFHYIPFTGLVMFILIRGCCTYFKNVFV